MSKIIIGVHGLGNKPSKEILGRWWCRSLREGLRQIDKPRVYFHFELFYWADIVHEKPLDLDIADPKDPLFLVEPYNPGRKRLEIQHGPIRKKLRDYLGKQMDKLFLNEDMTLNFTSVTDKIIRRYFREMGAYYSFTGPNEDSDIKFQRDEIRNRLADTLRRHKGKEILLLSHSLGSIIAYDVLSHTATDVPINTFITAGSPLGLPVIVGRVFSEQQQDIEDFDKIRTPENIKRNWFNFTDPRDAIAFDDTLKDDYAENSADIRVVDIPVNNDYENRGLRNPHKDYGYLRTPEMARVVYDFLHSGRAGFIQRWDDKLNRWLSDLIEKFK